MCPRSVAMDDLTAKIVSVPLTRGRRIIAIAGAPASGKSTLAAALQKQIDGCCVLPMDGFHLDNDTLDARGLLARKGAPETFDVAGLEALVRRLRTDQTLSFPTFDRTHDRVVPNGGTIGADVHTILVEGNYLLLTTAPWDRLRAHWDYTVLLDVPIQDLEARLIQRWIDNNHTPADARTRTRSNDLPNALYMQQNSAAPDLTVT